MTVTREEIIAEARSWLGVKWRHQGRNRESVDCLGLPVVVAKALNISNYDLTNYPRIPDAARFLEHFEKAGCIRINPLDGQDGDLVIFRQARFPCHVGILSTKHGVQHLLHASMMHKKVVEEPMPDARGEPGSPIVAVYRMPGIEN